jgi:hypothetical protein
MEFDFLTNTVIVFSGISFLTLPWKEASLYMALCLCVSSFVTVVVNQA